MPLPSRITDSTSSTRLVALKNRPSGRRMPRRKISRQTTANAASAVSNPYSRYGWVASVTWVHSAW